MRSINKILDYVLGHSRGLPGDSLVRDRRNIYERPVVITFTGGMGAQILSAAAYFHLQKMKVQVTADLSYFETPERVAVPGRSGDCSHWGWQLSPFGLQPLKFEVPTGGDKQAESLILHDGPDKLRLGLAGLRDAEIQDRFACDMSLGSLIPVQSDAGYLCLHIRRGDYVNVASHLVEDGAFISIANKFAGLIDCAVVVSDSLIAQTIRQRLQEMFSRTAFLDATDALTSHVVMRGARVLVCSNSQFSLVAAMLNPRALRLVPRKWFGAEQEHIELPVHELSSFEFLD